jgi:hypothetical protein
MQAIPPFVNQSVRDLAWACFGNNLIDDFSSVNNDKTISSCKIPLTEPRLQWLKKLDKDPRSLNEHLLRVRSPRLGIYFESLWQYFIKADNEFELIAHNLQVNHTNKTLGEFDLIYKNLNNNEHVHLELAIKFYLNASQNLTRTEQEFDADLHFWLGPNASDRLDKKVARLVNYQALLANNTAAKPVLEKLNIHNIRKQIALKGTLFYPHSLSNYQKQNSANPAIKKLISKEHHVGFWIPIDEFDKSNHGDNLMWKNLERRHWISPAFYGHTEEHNHLLNKKQMTSWLQDYFSTYWQPLLICSMKKQDANYVEEQRYMITANNWPLEKQVNHGNRYKPPETS